MLTQEDVDQIVKQMARYLESTGVNWTPLHPGNSLVFDPLMTIRDNRWPRLRKAFLVANPQCAVCVTAVEVVPHHVKPVHLFPELELDPDNLITFCPPHHLLFGHLMNWRAYNPQVIADAWGWKQHIEKRPMAAPPQTRLSQGLNHPDLVLERYEAFVRQYDPEGK